MNISRSRRYAAPLVILGIALVVGRTRTAPGWATSPREIKVTRGTNIAATVSPDQSSIVFDLQGILWSLPIAGGTATPLTQPLLEPARPDHAPRGGFVAFEAYSGGTFHIWAMDPDGRNVRQLTSGHADDRDPRVSPNGSKIAYSSDNAVFGSNYVIRIVDVASRTSTTVASDVPFEATFPIMRDSYTRKKFDFDSADKRQVVGIVGPALSPDAKQVAFEALNQIWLMEIGKKPRNITADTYYKCDPAWSLDGTKLAYSTDKSGIMKVYVYDVRTGRGDETAVTTFGGAQVSAAWSR